MQYMITQYISNMSRPIDELFEQKSKISPSLPKILWLRMRANPKLFGQNIAIMSVYLKI